MNAKKALRKLRCATVGITTGRKRLKTTDPNLDDRIRVVRYDESGKREE
jgi:hypothetical protein